MGDRDFTYAEAMSLRELKRSGLHGCVVEGNFEAVISWGMCCGSGSYRLLSILYEVRELVVSLSVSLSHVVRCQNGLVDHLANRGIVSHSLVCEKSFLGDC